jgi:hypothetical protein
LSLSGMVGLLGYVPMIVRLFAKTPVIQGTMTVGSVTSTAWRMEDLPLGHRQ